MYTQDCTKWCYIRFVQCNHRSNNTSEQARFGPHLVFQLVKSVLNIIEGSIDIILGHFEAL